MNDFPLSVPVQVYHYISEATKLDELRGLVTILPFLLRHIEPPYRQARTRSNTAEA